MEQGELHGAQHINRVSPEAIRRGFLWIMKIENKFIPKDHMKFKFFNLLNSFAFFIDKMRSQLK